MNKDRISQSVGGDSLGLLMGTLSILTSQLWVELLFFSFLFKILFISFQRKGGRKRGRENQCVVASHVPPTGDLAHNPGMCSDWELNQQPFDSQSGTQSLSHTSQGKNSFSSVTSSFPNRGRNTRQPARGLRSKARLDFSPCSITY